MDESIINLNYLCGDKAEIITPLPVNVQSKRGLEVRFLN